MPPRKVRVNITVDGETLARAKTKLRLFGGKLSTLFDAYLRDFVKSMDQEYDTVNKAVQQRFAELEARIQSLELARKIQREKI
jgi:N-acetylneuraminic acid mutarotase